MRINPKFQPALTALGMALLMGFVMPAAMTLASVGPGASFWPGWWRAVCLSDLVGIPLSLACSPLVARLATWLTTARPASPLKSGP